MSQNLLEGSVMILNTQDCPLRSNLREAYNFDSMICAFNKGTDTCQVRIKQDFMLQLNRLF